MTDTSNAIANFCKTLTVGLIQLIETARQLTPEERQKFTELLKTFLERGTR